MWVSASFDVPTCVPVMYVCWKAVCVHEKAALPCVRPLLCSVSEAC